MSNSNKRIRQDSAQSSNKKGKSSLELRVTLEEAVQFVDHGFKVSVLILGPDKQLHTGNENLTLKRPYLCFNDKDHQECDQSFLEIDEATWSPNLKNGRVTFEAKIKTLSRDQAGREFCLGVDTDDDNIGPSFSIPISVVQYKLSLVSNVPSKFYNQMGGGGNCITLELKCTDSDGELVKSAVPLEMILIYSDDGESVRTQDILTKSDDSQMTTVNGKSVMKVRIEHVSRKHQNRTFAIKIKPNLLINPLCANVACVVTPAINVLSKITPRDRRTETKIANHRSRILSSQRRGCMASHGNSFDNSSDDGTSSSNIPGLSLPSATFMPTANQDTSFQNMIHHNHTVSNTPAAPISDEDEVGGGAVDRVPTNSNTPVGEALSNILAWIDGTLKCLCDTQWRQVGFEQSGDGSESRPLYAMSNPNEKIQAQLNQYRSNVMGSLQTVLEGIEPLLEQGATGSPAVASTSNSLEHGARQVENDHPLPLSSDHNPHPPIRPTNGLERAGSNGMPNSAEFESLVSAVGFDSDPLEASMLLRGMSRGFSDFVPTPST